MNIILLVGISGSGKSTWRKEFMKLNRKYFIINRDKLRESIIDTLKDYYRRLDVNTVEKAINNLQEHIMKSAFQLGYDVIVDNTNLREKYINYYINYPGVKTFKFKIIDCAPELAKVRVIMRDYPDFSPVDDRLIDKTTYIDKQYEQFKNVKQWILKNYSENIIQ